MGKPNSCPKLAPFGVIFLITVFVLILYYTISSAGTYSRNKNDIITSEHEYYLNDEDIRTLCIELAHGAWKRWDFKVAGSSDGKLAIANIPYKTSYLRPVTREMGYSRSVENFKVVLPAVGKWKRTKELPQHHDMHKHQDPTQHVIHQASMDKDLTIWIQPRNIVGSYGDKLLANRSHSISSTVCVTIDGLPVIGVIYFPYQSLTVWGHVGHGYSGTLRPDWTGRASDEIHRILISRTDESHIKTKRANLDQKITELDGFDYQVLQLIQGKADAVVYSGGLRPWITCAANAILHSVKGKMTNLNGKQLVYKSKDVSKKHYKDAGIYASLGDHGTSVSVYKHFFKNKITSQK